MKLKTEPTPTLRVLGVMTGTSCDGLDAACVEIDDTGWRPLWSASAPFPKQLSDRVFKFQAPGTRQPIADWLSLNRDLGDWYGQALARLIARNGGKGGPEAPQAVANHGQTLAHFPAKRAQGTTLQLGDPTRIARATGLTVISHFRDGDLAAGGQGAPLVPLFHQLISLALGPSNGIAIHNLGGISNLTYIAPDGALLAFDTGPGNLWIDEATRIFTRGKQRFDRGGRIARTAQPDTKAVQAVLKHPYFKKSAPKSTGRDEFSFSVLSRATRAKGAALVATATAITAESIAGSYRQFVLKRGMPLERIYFVGGGAKNTGLLSQIRALLPGVEVSSLQETGFDPQMIEAQAFAYFGFLALCGQPIGGAWTGARGFGPPAHIIPGENWDEICAWLSVLHAAR